MKILLKCPTRARPQKVMDTLNKYMNLANRPDQIGVLVSCDTDDTTMTRNLVREELTRILSKAAWSNIVYGNSKSKIEACNADVASVPWEWDVIVLVSDDMIPQVKGYDDVIRSHMMTFPSTDAILWFNDGFQQDKLNTLTVFGRKMYDSFGYLYNPAYTSLFCDTELTDLCRTKLKDTCLYVPYCIIRHEHPATGYGGMDGLYQTNNQYFEKDLKTYISRKAYEYDWSVLIPTIPGREERLQTLIKRIRHMCSVHEIKVEICLNFDNREKSVGLKRQTLLQGAQGKYMSFVDDDDELTDFYFEDLKATIEGGYECMRLRGSITPYTFTHSIANVITGFMARGEEFLRPPNHLNPMMTDIAKFIPFKDAIRGEDLDWTLTLARHGFLKNEYMPSHDRIHYVYNVRTPVNQQTIEYQQTHTYEEMLQRIWIGANPPPRPQSRGGLRLGTAGFTRA